MEIQKIPVTKLNPAEYNPRVELRPGDKEYEKLKRSIVEFGFVEPVIWNRRTGNVVGGHQRLAVLRDLGQREVDCVVVDLDLPREKALNIALNKIQGDWDETKLSAIMADFDAAEFDISLTGFDANEVDALLNRFYSHEAKEDEFDAAGEKTKIEANGGPVTKPGDVWAMEDHVLICGDPADENVWKALLGDERADCVVTSPETDPKEYAKSGIGPWLQRMEKVAKMTAAYADVACVQVSDLSKTGDQYIEPMALHAMRVFGDIGFRPIWTRVWKMTGNLPTLTAIQNTSNKPNADYQMVTAFAGNDLEAYNDQEYAWISAYAAHAFQFVKRLTRDERRKWGYAGVWEIAAMRKNATGETQIPIELPWRCIKMHTDLRGIVIDPFGGLGSTLIACEQSGRRARVIERDPVHCDLMREEYPKGTKVEVIEMNDPYVRMEPGTTGVVDLVDDTGT